MTKFISNFEAPESGGILCQEVLNYRSFFKQRETKNWRVAKLRDKNRQNCQSANMQIKEYFLTEKQNSFLPKRGGRSRRSSARRKPETGRGFSGGEAAKRPAGSFFRALLVVALLLVLLAPLLVTRRNCFTVYLTGDCASLPLPSPGSPLAFYSLFLFLLGVPRWISRSPGNLPRRCEKRDGMFLDKYRGTRRWLRQDL